MTHSNSDQTSSYKQTLFETRGTLIMAATPHIKQRELPLFEHEEYDTWTTRYKTLEQFKELLL